MKRMKKKKRKKHFREGRRERKGEVERRNRRNGKITQGRLYSLGMTTIDYSDLHFPFG